MPAFPAGHIRPEAAGESGECRGVQRQPGCRTQETTLVPETSLGGEGCGQPPPGAPGM